MKVRLVSTRKVIKMSTERRRKCPFPETRRRPSGEQTGSPRGAENRAALDMDSGVTDPRLARFAPVFPKVM